MTGLDTDVQWLAKSQSTQETTGEHVTCTVGVDDLVVGKLGYGEGLGVGVSGGEVGLDSG